ncbi:MAG TPA: hypothetical protein VNH22_15335 [Blastocatellia bacterium]|jgi:hypothetical protein|nr:hypothetical protein [Blastocatellia bacterium]
MARKDHSNKNEDRFGELPDVSYIQNEDVQHEHTDVPVGPILKFLIFLLIAGLVIHIGMYFFFELLKEREKRATPPPGPFAEERSNIPPEPRLNLMPGHEVHPLDEWKQMKASEEGALSNYEWVDPKAGAVRIPIREAKRLVLQQGLPARPAPPRPEELEGAVPSDQSSGRMPERRRQ